MASSRIIEEESGTYTGQRRHPHNGYYAGDFSQMPLTVPELRSVLYKPDLRHRDVPLAWH
jgi:hypothetical protein